MTGSRAPAPSLPDLGVVPVVGRARGQFTHPLDGRYGALDPRELRAVVAWLAAQLAVDDFDCALGIPEGGLVPAYAFAAATGLRVALGTVWQPDLPGVISFAEKHDPPPLTFKHVYGLAPGDRVVVVEDEVTSGHTIVNCVRALRAAGIRCDTVVSVYAADDPAMRARLAAEGIRLIAAGTFAPNLGMHLYAAAAAGPIAT